MGADDLARGWAALRARLRPEAGRRCAGGRALVRLAGADLGVLVCAGAALLVRHLAHIHRVGLNPTAGRLRLLLLTAGLLVLVATGVWSARCGLLERMRVSPLRTLRHDERREALAGVRGGRTVDAAELPYLRVVAERVVTRCGYDLAWASGLCLVGVSNLVGLGLPQLALVAIAGYAGLAAYLLVDARRAGRFLALNQPPLVLDW
jgi:hypothetical protein